MKYLVQKLYKYMLNTLTWSRVFTMAKKVTSVATLTVNIRVLVKTNWWQTLMFWTWNIQKRNILLLAGRERPEPRRNQWFRRGLEQLSVRVLEPKEHSVLQEKIRKCRSTYDSMLRFQSIIHQRQNICKYIWPNHLEKEEWLTYVLWIHSCQSCLATL